MPSSSSEIAYRQVTSKPPTSKGSKVNTAGSLFVSALDWRIIRGFEPFEVGGLIVTPLPVEHGELGPMLAFEFRATVPAALEAPPSSSASALAARLDASEPVGITPDAVAPAPTADASPSAAAASSAADILSVAPVEPAGDRVLWISGIAALPLDTRQYLLSGPPIDLLFLDAHNYHLYPGHFSIGQALACAVVIKAKRTVFVGMNHAVNYHVDAPRVSAWAAEHGLSIEL